LRTVCIVQARTGSTRLPGKVMLDIAGEPMLERVVERCRAVEGVDEIVVATTSAERDRPVAELASRIGVGCHRGSEDDVLERYVEAARRFRAEAIVRITADCPLLDPGVSSRVVARFSEESPDYASNVLRRTYPRGLDTEVITRTALEAAHDEAIERDDREHVTRFVWQRPQRFHLLSVEGEVDRSALRWTVDTAEDLQLVRLIYERLGHGAFATAEVVELLEHNPEWAAINAHVEQRPA
jgi:spore coat polysaccharide biosynthesis protein SpsF